MRDIKNALLVVNDKKDHVKNIASKLIDELERRKISFHIITPSYFELPDNNYLTDFDDKYRHEKYELIFTIGGDGTFLYTARTFMEFNIPIVGINAGRLGFMMEVSPDQIPNALDQIINKQIHFTNRIMLEVTVHRDGKEIGKFHSFNEAVMSKGSLSRMMEINVTISGNLLSGYRSDGLIVSTPNGSTAYNLSAGGPILTPDTKAFIITPICPHTFGVRPVVISSNSEIAIEIKNTDRNSHLTVDGQENIGIEPGDLINIKKSEKFIRMYYFGDSNFFKTLRAKLGWNL